MEDYGSIARPIRCVVHRSIGGRKNCGVVVKVTELTRRVLAVRREDRAMTAAGYRKHETDWEIHRGMRRQERIVDAKVSIDGKYVWTKIA